MFGWPASRSSLEMLRRALPEPNPRKWKQSMITWQMLERYRLSSDPRNWLTCWKLWVRQWSREAMSWFSSPQKWFPTSLTSLAATSHMVPRCLRTHLRVVLCCGTGHSELCRTSRRWGGLPSGGSSSFSAQVAEQGVNPLEVTFAHCSSCVRRLLVDDQAALARAQNESGPLLTTSRSLME